MRAASRMAACCSRLPTSRSAIGRRSRQEPPAGLITASLTADFAGAAKIGDWVEAHVDVQKVGGRLAFANAFLMVDGERIVRAARCSPAPRRCPIRQS